VPFPDLRASVQLPTSTVYREIRKTERAAPASFVLILPILLLFEYSAALTFGAYQFWVILSSVALVLSTFRGTARWLSGETLGHDQDRGFLQAL
jgi:hypothetical protein